MYPIPENRKVAHHPQRVLDCQTADDRVRPSNRERGVVPHCVRGFRGVSELSQVVVLKQLFLDFMSKNKSFVPGW